MKILRLVLLMFAFTTLNATEPSTLDDARMARFQHLTQTLKCVQCEANNLADSDAVIAKNMKTFIKKRLLAGDSDDDIVTFLTQRYGEQINTRPNTSGKTLWLWLLPPLFLVIGFGLIFRRLGVTSTSTRKT